MPMPKGLSLLKDFLHRRASQALTGLYNRTGRHKGAIAGQHDIELVYDLTHRQVAEQSHTDDAPDHHLQR